MSDVAPARTDLSTRLARLALYRWWRRAIVGRVDHEAVIARIVEESGWSPRFAFMTVNRRPKRTPYRRAKGTPFVEQRNGYDGRTVRAGCGVGRA